MSQQLVQNQLNNISPLSNSYINCNYNDMSSLSENQQDNKAIQCPVFIVQKSSLQTFTPDRRQGQQQQQLLQQQTEQQELQKGNWQLLPNANNSFNRLFDYSKDLQNYSPQFRKQSNHQMIQEDFLISCQSNSIQKSQVSFQTNKQSPIVKQRASSIVIVKDEINPEPIRNPFNKVRGIKKSIKQQSEDDSNSTKISNTSPTRSFSAAHYGACKVNKSPQNSYYQIGNNNNNISINTVVQQAQTCLPNNPLKKLLKKSKLSNEGNTSRLSMIDQSQVIQQPQQQQLQFEPQQQQIFQSFSSLNVKDFSQIKQEDNQIQQKQEQQQVSQSQKSTQLSYTINELGINLEELVKKIMNNINITNDKDVENKLNYTKSSAIENDQSDNANLNAENTYPTKSKQEKNLFQQQPSQVQTQLSFNNLNVSESNENQTYLMFKQFEELQRKHSFLEMQFNKLINRHDSLNTSTNSIANIDLLTQQQQQLKEQTLLQSSNKKQSLPNNSNIQQNTHQNKQINIDIQSSAQKEGTISFALSTFNGSFQQQQKELKITQFQKEQGESNLEIDLNQTHQKKIDLNLSSNQRQEEQEQAFQHDQENNFSLKDVSGITQQEQTFKTINFEETQQFNQRQKEVVSDKDDEEVANIGSVCKFTEGDLEQQMMFSQQQKSQDQQKFFNSISDNLSQINKSQQQNKSSSNIINSKQQQVDKLVVQIIDNFRASHHKQKEMEQPKDRDSEDIYITFKIQSPVQKKNSQENLVSGRFSSIDNQNNCLQNLPINEDHLVNQLNSPSAKLARPSCSQNFTTPTKLVKANPWRNNKEHSDKIEEYNNLKIKSILQLNHNRQSSLATHTHHEKTKSLSKNKQYEESCYMEAQSSEKNYSIPQAVTNPCSPERNLQRQKFNQQQKGTSCKKGSLKTSPPQRRDNQQKNTCLQHLGLKKQLKIDTDNLIQQQQNQNQINVKKSKPEERNSTPIATSQQQIKRTKSVMKINPPNPFTVEEKAHIKDCSPQFKNEEAIKNVRTSKLCLYQYKARDQNQNSQYQQKKARDKKSPEKMLQIQVKEGLRMICENKFNYKENQGDQQQSRNYRPTNKQYQDYNCNQAQIPFKDSSNVSTNCGVLQRGNKYIDDDRQCSDNNWKQQQQIVNVNKNKKSLSTEKKRFSLGLLNAMQSQQQSPCSHNNLNDVRDELEQLDSPFATQHQSPQIQNYYNKPQHYQEQQPQPRQLVSLLNNQLLNQHINKLFI